MYKINILIEYMDVDEVGNLCCLRPGLRVGKLTQPWIPVHQCDRWIPTYLRVKCDELWEV